MLYCITIRKQRGITAYKRSLNWSICFPELFKSVILCIRMWFFAKRSRFDRRLIIVLNRFSTGLRMVQEFLINFMDEPAGTESLQISPLIPVKRIAERCLFFCPGNLNIEESSLFFKLACTSR